MGSGLREFMVRGGGERENCSWDNEGDSGDEGRGGAARLTSVEVELKKMHWALASIAAQSSLSGKASPWEKRGPQTALQLN